MKFGGLEVLGCGFSADECGVDSGVDSSFALRLLRSWIPAPTALCKEAYTAMVLLYWRS